MSSDAEAEPHHGPEESSFDIATIISAERIRTLFQPLVSVKQRRVIGFEMLSRGLHPLSGDLISPQSLFAEAETAGVTLPLDRLCRKSAFRQFAAFPGSADYFASVNLEVSILTSRTVGSNVVYAQVLENGIDPRQVIIEMLERRIRDEEMLLQFAREYRKRGFLIALDDVGAGYSNLDRVALIGPDIIKTDRSLIRGITRSFHKQGLMEALVNLAHTIGALVIAEGVETQEEALLMMQMGADVLQGYLFGRPSAPESIQFSAIREQMDSAAVYYRKRTVDQTRERREQFARYGTMVDAAVEVLTGCDPANLTDALKLIVSREQGVECMYVLDDTGTQLTETVFRGGQLIRSTNRMFRPAAPGTDHSNKDYCFYLLSGFPTFTTLPYVSLATGERCVTIAKMYQSAGGAHRILCTDIRYEAPLRE